MASGKTHWAKEFAQEKGVPMIDLDAYIADRERRSISEIFEKLGEAGFRQLETRYLKEVCGLYADFVMSTGGGTPCFNGNMEYMNEQGHTVFLNTDVDLIVGRLIKGKHKRPLISKLRDEEIRPFVIRHLGERLLYYRQAKEEVGRKS